ncbi:unnamed protein product [Malus baccata var. baccata]
MTRSSQPVHKHIFDFNDDFERTLRRARNQQDPQPSQPTPDLEEDKVEEQEEATERTFEEVQDMAVDNRTINELSASGWDNALPLCIQYPRAAQNKTDGFKLKSSLLHHILKFHGLSMEDPNKHLKEFEVVCSSMTPVNVDGSILKMKAFPFSHLEKAKDLLYELAPRTVTSWKSMKRAFLEKFFQLLESFYYTKGLVAFSKTKVVENPKEQSVAACGVCSMNGHLTDKCPQLIENRRFERSSKFQMEGTPTNPTTKCIQTTTPGILSKALLTTLAKGQENQAKDMHNYAKEVQNQARDVTELKRQMGQMAKLMGQFSREPGKLPSSTDVNPKGGFKSAKAITLRSGKEAGSDPNSSKSNQKEDENMQSEKKEQGLPSARIKQSLPQPPTHPNSTTKGKLGSNSMTSNSIPTNAPFPCRFMQSKKDESDKDIIDTFRKVQVNIPLLDAIKQVPKYAKFLKGLCTTKKRASNKKVVRVSENVSAVLQRKLPPKCKDPDSFTIPYFIGNTRFESAMLDLGASINVMLYSIYASMNLGELKNDGVIIQLADRSNAYPKGVLEDVLVHAHGNNKEHLAVPIQEEFVEMVATLKSNPTHIGKFPNLISIPNSTNKLLPSVIQPPSLELKPLPSHLKYVFLGEQDTLPVIISSSLTAQEDDKLVRVLREYRTAIGWTLADINGISSTTYMYRILLEEGAKPSKEAQRRLNPPMMDVVKKEIIKLLDCEVIYPISDSHWVSQVQVVPKKSGVTVVKNEDNELVPTRIQTEWRVCIDYWKLNATTRKDHFPLPFIDQMLERRFIKDFSKIVQPFCRLLQKEVAFEFNKECETAFKTFKDMLTSAPIIMPTDWSLPFELMWDASDYAICAILGQRRNKQPHVIHYTSQTLNDA